MKEVYEKAKGFIMKEGTDTQKTLFRHLMGEETKQSAIQALSRFQNEDGGWGNGIEIEYEGNISSSMSTIAALGYIYFFDLSDSDLFKRTLDYLVTTQKEDGSWDDPNEITKLEIPPYYGPGKSLEYKTGMIIKWLKRLNTDNDEMISKAIGYMINNFEKASEKQDIWVVLGYINAFVELQNLKETPEILQWAMSVLNPSREDSNKKIELPWPQVQGMIYDDDRMLEDLRDEVIEAIKKMQLKDGDWPHQFGIYNKVWAAILIVRFLKINNKI